MVRLILILSLLIVSCSKYKEPILSTYEINMYQLEAKIDSPEQHRVIIQVEDKYILDTALREDYHSFIYRFKTNDAVIFYLNSYPRKIFAYAYIYKDNHLVWEGRCFHKMTLRFK